MHDHPRAIDWAANQLGTVEGTDVPAPSTIAVDPEGRQAGFPAHLMSRLPGTSTRTIREQDLATMVDMLLRIHAVRPATPFRDFQSWAPAAKWVVPPWSRHPDSWERAFEILAGPAPSFTPTFIHRDHSHRNLLWSGDEISGVVDWVETSTGPAWLDAAHAATNLALEYGPTIAATFAAQYAEHADNPPDQYWLVMDAVGFLPQPGDEPLLFGDDEALARLDEWMRRLTA